MNISRTVLFTTGKQLSFIPSSSRAPALAKRSYAGSDHANTSKPTPPDQESKEPQSSSQAKAWTVAAVGSVCGIIFYNFNPFRTLSPPINMTGKETSAAYESQDHSQGVKGGGGIGKVVGGSDTQNRESSAWKSTAATFENKK
ncbi:hypothetical protein [Phaffia rhodozyma]|uniref:Uncharacterized protein n=1 Tax=Phaffia rhodozyma TaxID=264483 RepID=A0A0F7SJX8_PHARH|nr:hypothetical protein [Phaffia rhodozyma]